MSNLLARLSVARQTFESLSHLPHQTQCALRQESRERSDAHSLACTLTPRASAHIRMRIPHEHDSKESMLKLGMRNSIKLNVHDETSWAHDMTAMPLWLFVSESPASRLRVTHAAKTTGIARGREWEWLERHGSGSSRLTTHTRR